MVNRKRTSAIYSQPIFEELKDGSMACHIVTYGLQQPIVSFTYDVNDKFSKKSKSSGLLWKFNVMMGDVVTSNARIISQMVSSKVVPVIYEFAARQKEATPDAMRFYASNEKSKPHMRLLHKSLDMADNMKAIFKNADHNLPHPSVILHLK